MGRNSNLQGEELEEIRRQFENERRNSTSIEAAVLNLQKENKRLNDEIQDFND
jgi:predicted  nucleic acid-binding Zn-ribbon protein